VAAPSAGRPLQFDASALKQRAAIASGSGIGEILLRRFSTALSTLSIPKRDDAERRRDHGSRNPIAARNRLEVRHWLAQEPTIASEP